MNILNLYKGLIAKNYKHMCEILEEDIKTSNSKLAQLKEWDRFFSYHKDGNKFIVDEIYLVPQVKEDNRGKSIGSRNNNKVTYTSNIETLVLNLLAQGRQGYGKIFLSKHMLLKELKMINNNYAYCKQRIPKLSKFMNIDRLTVQEWYESASSTMERNLETALKDLEDKSLIIWSKEITVVEAVPLSNITNNKNITRSVYVDSFGETINEYKVSDMVTLSHREGTDKEKQYIAYAEREVLKELDCIRKSEIINKGLWEEFLDKVNAMILKHCNLAYYYKSYKVLFNEEHIYEVVDDMGDYILDSNTESKEENMLNSSVSEKINKNSLKRHMKSKSEINDIGFGTTNDAKLLRRSAKNYVEDNFSLNETLIVIGANDIKNKVRIQK